MTTKIGKPSAEDQALAKYRALLPYLQGNVSLTSIAKANGRNVRTIRRWLRDLDHKGFAGLKRRPRADRGKTSVPEELKGLIEGLYLRCPPMPASTIHRKIQVVCKQHNWSVPSYSSVYGIISALEPSLVMLAQEGRKAYCEKFDIVLIREADRANEIWQADHKELDVTVLDEFGNPCRPWLTGIIDDYSRAVPGYYIGTEAPSILRTALALRQGIWKKSDASWAACGVPDEFYVDHGSDFTSRHLEEVAADLKITLTFSTVGVPRGRGKIERFFRSVNQLLCAGLPGYLSPRTKNDRPLLTLDQFKDVFHKWLVSDYMYREHSEIDTTPFLKWNADNFIPRLPDSLEGLDLLLLTVKKKRSVRTDGIHFDGMRYTSLALANIVGYDVVVRYDPRDLSELKVYLNDQFLCTAVCEGETARSANIKDIATARNRRRKILGRTINARAELVKLYLQSASGERKIENGYESPSSPCDTIQPQRPSGLKLYAADFAAAKARGRTVPENG